MTWTTLLDPEVTHTFMGSEQLHGAWFVPKDWPGKGPSVVMEVPAGDDAGCYPIEREPYCWPSKNAQIPLCRSDCLPY
jgi:hypothetical protein